jgi:hypothetical protein
LINTLTPIKADLESFDQEEMKRREMDNHQNLIGCLEFLYEHPARWFDSSHGCNLMPGHPSNITPRAMDEMEAKYPGYKYHIAIVLSAMQAFPWNHDSVLRYLTVKNETVKQFMDFYRILPGVLVD